MNFCPSCGTQLSDPNAAFCAGCGMRLALPEQPAQAEVPFQSPVSAPPPNVDEDPTKVYHPHQMSGTPPLNSSRFQFEEPTSQIPVVQPTQYQRQIQRSPQPRQDPRRNQPRRQQQRKPPKPTPMPEPDWDEVNDGYDGYYNDVDPMDDDDLHDGIDSELIKKVALVVVGLFVVVGLCVAAMYFL
ncbi:MAG: zinc ribbon domain-containing protein [Oscillospiraceae bacterium]|nr:zinc ribbon domain-containing protein [Oscillospiraceae bacterium]